MPTYKDRHQYIGGDDTLSMGHYKVKIIHKARLQRQTPIIHDMVKFAETLPHGSGIDGNWTIHVQRNGNVQVRGEYHHMTEHGYYDGWSTFTLHMNRVNKDTWNPLKGPCEGKVQRVYTKGDIMFRVTGGRNEDDRDYFYDVLSTVMAMVRDWNNDKGERVFSRAAAMELGFDGGEPCL